MLIGILQTGRAPDALRPVHGDYPDLFARLLGGHDLTFRTWAVLDGEMPDGPEAADGWLITGSRHGAYDDLPWIAPLEAFIRDVAASGRPLVGICFGHQIVAQALGGRVAKHPGGWSVGRTEYDWDGRRVALNAWHQDQVTEVPEGGRVVGRSDFCENAMIVYEGAAGPWALTLQPHPEFDREWTADMIEGRGRGLVPDLLLDAAAEATARPTDDAEVAARIARFLRERALGETA